MRAILLGFFIAPLLLAPARADELALNAARDVITAQERAFAQDDAATAYAQAAPSIQQLFPVETFMAMVRGHYAPVYRHKRFDFLDAKQSGDEIEQNVAITDQEGVAWVALYTLERQDGGGFRITSCMLRKVGEAA